MNTGKDKTFKELLNAYYGGPASEKRVKRRKRLLNLVTYSKVFENNDNLVQKNATPAFEEYVVMQSTINRNDGNSNEVFEEYVVQCSVTDTEAFEEYTVMSGQQSTGVTDLYASTASLSYHDVSPAEEFQIDLAGPLSGANTNMNTNNGWQEAQRPGVSMPPTEYIDYNPTPSQAPAPPAAPVSLAASDNDFEEDFKAILSGQKVFDPATKKTVEKEQLGRQQSAPTPAPSSTPEFSNGHAIFDEIAKKMQYATAYDLGVLELDKRFSDFDKVSEVQKLANLAKAKRSTAATVYEQSASVKPEINTAEFINDLDAIKRGMRGETIVATSSGLDMSTALVVPAVNSTEWPLRPANLRPIRLAEKIQAFGQFTYVDDPSQFGGDGIRVTNDWATQNIVSVPIPQLNGKTFGGHVINNGSINFHRQGADRLRNLWAAWENAGLLDRILTFEGGYAARYIRHTQSRSPRPLSNHAWGTAFDINASLNGFGVQPPVVGQRGCVRELVAIANQNGFFWGGHFTTKDGMHFEIGHAV